MEFPCFVAIIINIFVSIISFNSKTLDNIIKLLRLFNINNNQFSLLSNGELIKKLSVFKLLFTLEDCEVLDEVY